MRESADELVLRTAEDKEVAIPIKDIDERKMGGSLMPDGLTDVLTRGELVDLVRFLSELGKVGPYSVSKARLVRRWQALEATPEARQLLQASGPAAAAVGRPGPALGAGLQHGGRRAAAGGLAAAGPGQGGGRGGGGALPGGGVHARPGACCG